MSTTAAIIYSFRPATSETVHDNAEFIVFSPKKGSFEVKAEGDQKEPESDKQSGTAGPSSITKFKTSGVLGEFKWQAQIDGSAANDYLLRAAIHANETWKTIAAASHKVLLTGATYTVATGLLDLTTLSGVQPDNLADGWVYSRRVRLCSTTLLNTSGHPRALCCRLHEHRVGDVIVMRGEP